MDTLFLALRVIVSLGAVFGALWFAHRWITKGRPGGLGSRTITVVARQGLGAKAGVAIVEAGGRQYLLGVTEHAVSVLDRFDGADGLQTVAPTAVIVTTGPVARPDFGDALAAAVAATGAIPVTRAGEITAPVVLPAVPTVPVPTARRPAQVLQITAAVPIVPHADAFGATRRAALAETPTAPHPTRRAARRAEGARARTSPIAGSVLSPDTWRQAAAALKALR